MHHVLVEIKCHRCTASSTPVRSTCRHGKCSGRAAKQKAVKQARVEGAEQPTCAEQPDLRGAARLAREQPDLHGSSRPLDGLRSNSHVGLRQRGKQSAGLGAGKTSDSEPWNLAPSQPCGERRRPEKLAPHLVDGWCCYIITWYRSDAPAHASWGDATL